MADEKLTDRDYFNTDDYLLDLEDVIHIVDVSNAEQDPAGSSFKLKLETLINFIIQNLPASPNIYNTDGTLTANRTLLGDGLELNFNDVSFRIIGNGAPGDVVVAISDTDPIASFFTSHNVVFGRKANSAQTQNGRVTIIGGGTTSGTTAFSVLNNNNTTTELLGILDDGSVIIPIGDMQFTTDTQAIYFGVKNTDGSYRFIINSGTDQFIFQKRIAGVYTNLFAS